MRREDDKKEKIKAEKRGGWRERKTSGCDLHGDVSPLLLSHSIVLFSDRLTELQEVSTARKNKSTGSMFWEWRLRRRRRR